MNYKRFTIRNYRAITGPLELRLDKHLLMPIIGVNESGKTTILQAIFACDHYNDGLNDDGRQLRDVSNLYRASSPPATVEAEVELDLDDVKTALEDCAKEYPDHKVKLEALRRKKSLPNTLTIRRNIATGKYLIPSYNFGDEVIQDIVARELIVYLPYTLYFDDFRDKIAERIEIPLKADDYLTGWIAIIQRLFNKTDKTFSIFKLSQREPARIADGQRKGQRRHRTHTRLRH